MTYAFIRSLCVPTKHYGVMEILIHIHLCKFLQPPLTKDLTRPGTSCPLLDKLTSYCVMVSFNYFLSTLFIVGTVNLSFLHPCNESAYLYRQNVSRSFAGTLSPPLHPVHSAQVTDKRSYGVDSSGKRVAHTSKPVSTRTRLVRLWHYDNLNPSKSSLDVIGLNSIQWTEPESGIESDDVAWVVNDDFVAYWL